MPIPITERSAAIYSPLILKIYDWWVLGISNSFAWKCSTAEVLLPFFRKYFSSRHLDVGVGTGFYLANTEKSAFKEITLLDLNANSLNTAAKQISPVQVKCILHNILRPLPLKQQNLFDSISIFYLLHCLPGTLVEKEQVIINLKNCLNETGVLYGATILGLDAKHNFFGGKLMTIYNNKGIFSNKEDTLIELQKMLGRHFNDVKIQQHGKVALFVARNT